MPRYNVELKGEVVETNLNMIGLVVKYYIKTEWMQDAVGALQVGDGQLSDKDDYYIIRVK